MYGSSSFPDNETESNNLERMGFYAPISLSTRGIERINTESPLRALNMLLEHMLFKMT